MLPGAGETFTATRSLAAIESRWTPISGSGQAFGAGVCCRPGTFPRWSGRLPGRTTNAPSISPATALDSTSSKAWAATEKKSLTVPGNWPKPSSGRAHFTRSTRKGTLAMNLLTASPSIEMQARPSISGRICRAKTCCEPSLATAPGARASLPAICPRQRPMRSA